ncbi:MAG: ABC-type peptide transport system, periplasmic component, partial [Deinococcota bacterium]
MQKRFNLALAFGILGVTAAMFAVAAPPSAKKQPSFSNIGLTTGKVGGTLTLAVGSAPTTFMYYGAIDGAAQRVAQHMFNGLIESNLATAKIEPALAESWTVSPDGKVYNFKLRQGVKWHDGVEFTADDVVFTFDQIIANKEA